MQWYIDALKKYFDFKGRTGRKAFWMFVAINFIFTWIALGLDNLFSITGHETYLFTNIKFGAFYNYYSLLIAIPSIAIVIRRLHDTGKKWTSFFLVFIPAVGQIWILVMMLTPGEAYDNEYGPAPEDGFTGAHPYEKQNIENEIAKAERAEITPDVTANTSKVKKEKETSDKKGFWIQDRGAVDFRKPSKGKRKTL